MMTATKKHDRKSAPLERYFRIIEALCSHPDGLALNDIADMLLLPKPTAHRLLATMQDLSLVSISGGRGQTYSLGDRVKRLALYSLDDSWLRSFTGSILSDLSEEIGETCYVAKLEGHAVRSIAMESPDSPWRGFVLPGKILQPHATASAKTIMAFQPKDIINQVLNGPLEKLTKHTLTTRAAVEADYKKIREMGYGTCIGEVDEALAAVAVPISVGDLGIAYSLGVVGPLPRITSLIKNDVNPLLAKHARAIATAFKRASP